MKRLDANISVYERGGKGLITPDRATFIEPWVTKIIQSLKQQTLLEAMKNVDCLQQRY